MTEPGPAALQELIHGSEEGMLLVGEDGTILYANRACERLFGVMPEELVGRSGAELCRPEHLFIAREVLMRSLDTPGERVTTSIDIVREGGDLVTVDARVVNRAGSPGIGALVVHMRESSATASQVADSYRALFDNALVGMGVADMQGNLLAFNAAMLDPGGYTREDIERIGNVAKLYADEADRPRMLQTLRAKGYVWREPVPFLRKDGSAYPTLLTLTPVVFMGRPCLYATVEAQEERD